ncbi:MAG: helix-turn-helix transcriptional regulator [Flammeovirgaceae bacterium]|nr:helix-turn-helix transcriptional regulator [Flammeovirgaceae bacterium]
MKGNLKIVFGETLKELRLQKSLTQQQLADYTGMDRAFISELERGILLPSLETFFKLAYQLKIKPRDLADKIDQKLGP